MLADFYFEHLAKLEKGDSARTLEDKFVAGVALKPFEGPFRLKLEPSAFLTCGTWVEYVSLNNKVARLTQLADRFYQKI